MDPSPNRAPDPGFAWRPHGTKHVLTVTDESLLNRSRRDRLSASTAKSMHGCAVRWFYDKVTPREEDPFSAANIGTAVHTVFELLYALPREDRTRSRFEQILSEQADAQWDTEEPATDAGKAAVRMAKAKWHADVTEAAVGLFKFENPAEVEVLSMERKFETTIAGVPFVGYGDREARHPDGGLCMDDYKSSKKVPNLFYGDDHGDQLRIYALAKEALDGVRPDHARVLYTRLGVIRDDVDLSETAMDKTLKGFKLAWKRHNRYHDTGEFPTKVSALCGWCPLVDLCPSAQAEGKSAADGIRAITRDELDIPTLALEQTPVPAAVTAAEDAGLPVDLIVPPEVLGDYDHAFDPDFPEPELIRPAGDSAHDDDEAAESPAAPTQEGTAMTIITEGKAWESTLRDGSLNPNSYASMGLFGLQQKAIEVLHTHADGQGVDGADVQALFDTFCWIVAEAQEAWTGSRDPGEGASTRMRGVLYSFIDREPVPVDDGAEAMGEWAERAVGLCVATTEMVRETFVSIPAADAQPWLDLYEGAEV